MSVPRLRFKDEKCGFPDWAEESLGNIAELTSSKRVYLSDYVNEGVPFYRGKEISELKRNEKPKDILYITRSAYESFKKNYGVPKINDILITAVGTLGNVYRVKDESEFYFKDGNLIWLKNIKISSEFLEILIDHNNDKLQKSAIGSTQRALIIVELKKLKFNIPTLPEQTKIANFLTAVDEKITHLTQKHTLLTQYKKGVMQQIFSQQLRFKDDDGQAFPKWKDATLESLLDYEQPTKYLVSSTEYSDSFRIPVLTAGKTFILGYTDETVGIYEHGLPVIIFDDFTTAFKFVPFQFKAKSSAMKILRLKGSTNSIKYIYAAMQMIDFPCGDEHKRYWISEYSKISIQLPCAQEQTKIANFLTAIDDKLSAVQTQLTAMKQYKQGLLQQMFV
jgi:type I restriction enzyme S subunit